MSPHPVLGRVWGVRPGSSSACSPGRAGVWLAVCPLARVPERKEPARLLLFWVVVPTALPYIWHVEAITAESCGAARLPARGGAHALWSVCAVTFQGWISTSADRKQKRFCAERKRTCSCYRQRLRLPPPVRKLPRAVGVSALPSRPCMRGLWARRS